MNRASSSVRRVSALIYRSCPSQYLDERTGTTWYAWSNCGGHIHDEADRIKRCPTVAALADILSQ